MICLIFLRKRTYDIGVVTEKSIRVRFNNKPVPNKSFEQYMDVYIGDKTEAKRVFESPNKKYGKLELNFESIR